VFPAEPMWGDLVSIVGQRGAGSAGEGK